MTPDQWGAILEAFGPWAFLILMASYWFVKGFWPWFKDRQKRIDKERTDRLDRDEADKRARLDREEAARVAREKRYEEQEARHRADLLAIIAENHASTQKRALTDEKVADALYGIRKMYEENSLLQKIQAELAEIKREMKHDATSTGR